MAMTLDGPSAVLRNLTNDDEGDHEILWVDYGDLLDAYVPRG